MISYGLGARGNSVLRSDHIYKAGALFLVVACLWLIKWYGVVCFDDCDAVLLCLNVVGYRVCTLSVLAVFRSEWWFDKLCLWTMLHYDLLAIKDPGAYTCSNVRERVGCSSCVPLCVRYVVRGQGVKMVGKRVSFATSSMSLGFT